VDLNKQIIVKEQNQKKYIACLPGLLLVRYERDILDLLGICGENDTNLILFHAENFAPEFFDLKSGLAGMIFQKFSNYYIKAVAVIAFEKISRPRFRELISECNHDNQFRFFENVHEAEDWLVR